MANIFSQVGVKRPSKSVFNLSYQKSFSGDLGYLYPVCQLDCVPSDVFSIAAKVLVRFLPMVGPIMHPINAYLHYFFVPYRRLMIEDELGDAGDFESMLIRGSDGNTDITIPSWSVTDNAVGSLWDYLEQPTGYTVNGRRPVDFLKRAYNFIVNEYYLDVELDTQLDITTAEDLQEARWPKDWFTSARLTQQRGTAPALPVTISGDSGDITVYNTSDATARTLELESTANVESVTTPSGGGNMRWSDPGLQATSFDISDMRLAIREQLWQERNMRAGVRYHEVIKSHFGQDIGDSRIDRPEFIGGMKVPIIISEVLQTESSDASTAQGTMAGHGIAANTAFIGKYRCPEYGIIMGLLNVMPVTMYAQGSDRAWYKGTYIDFYFPEFAQLSEQPVYRSEIYATSNLGENTTIFGYQGRWNEMRYRKNVVCGKLRPGQSLDYWTFCRNFASAPTLNANFVRSRYSTSFEGGIDDSQVFAAPSEHTMVVNVGNQIKAVRPLPIISNPSPV